MEKREIDLTVSCYGKVKGVKYDVVILPWGATEPHNLHLPYLTDCILPHDIAVDAAALALQNSGVRCMVMPPVPFGAHNPGQRELPFCIHTRYSTQQAILEDIVASLYAQGMRKLIILSGHGGNNFKGRSSSPFLYISSTCALPPAALPAIARTAPRTTITSAASKDIFKNLFIL